MNRQTILLFNISEDKKKKIGELCKKLGIDVVSVHRTLYAQKLGYLAGITGFKKDNAVYMGSELPAEMMVFSGMSSEQVEVYLKKYREAGIESIGCKAVITADNIFWTAESLFKELMIEHMHFLTESTIRKNGR